MLPSAAVAIAGGGYVGRSQGSVASGPPLKGQGLQPLPRASANRALRIPELERRPAAAAPEIFLDRSHTFTNANPVEFYPGNWNDAPASNYSTALSNRLRTGPSGFAGLVLGLEVLLTKILSFLTGRRVGRSLNAVDEKIALKKLLRVTIALTIIAVCVWRFGHYLFVAGRLDLAIFTAFLIAVVFYVLKHF